jgi:Sec7-like guanine-nucleotide exchange factor
MKREEFVNNNRGINDGDDLPRPFLESIYDNIVGNEIKMDKNLILPKAIKRGWINVKHTLYCVEFFSSIYSLSFHR